MDLRFEIVGEAVHGGMGSVYRARDHKEHRDVAIKTIDDAGNLARFAREARLLATVRHPNIVHYVAHGDRYLVMEWIAGETLADHLHDAGVTPREAIDIARQLAGALAALHAAQIVHRDVKPSNTMLVGGVVKLVDFGVARKARFDARLTATNAPVGTAGYMAPEQIRGGGEVDAPADLFALGCVLYECLTGTRAFAGNNAFALRAMVLLHDPPPVRSVAPHLPAGLDELVSTLLSRSPDARPTAVEAEAALATIATQLDGRHDEAVVVAREHVATETSGRAVYAVVCAAAQLEARRDVEVFDGGAAVACSSLDRALVRAASLASHGAVVIARGESLASAVEASSRVLAAIIVAAQIAGEEPTGTWLDEVAARELDPDRFSVRKRDRARLA